MFKKLFGCFTCKKPRSGYAIFGDDKAKYQSRDILLRQLPEPLCGPGLTESSRQHVEVAIVGTDPLMLNIARQALLLCHFPNFNEDTGEKRTRITLIAPDASPQSLDAIMERLRKEDMLGNLPNECPWRIIASGKVVKQNAKPSNYLDVCIDIVGVEKTDVEKELQRIAGEPDSLLTVIAGKGMMPEGFCDSKPENCLQTFEVDEKAQDVPMAVDLTEAFILNMAYIKGVEDRNLNPDDIKDALTYGKLLHDKLRKMSNAELRRSWETMQPKLKLSCLYSADMRLYHLASAAGEPEGNYKEQMRSITEHLSGLCRAEHARWNVERLILGYRPYTAEEMAQDGAMTAAERNIKRKDLKRKGIHINIGSYKRMECVDQGASKYDAFILLAIPTLLRASR